MNWRVLFSDRAKKCWFSTLLENVIGHINPVKVLKALSLVNFIYSGWVTYALHGFLDLKDLGADNLFIVQNLYGPRESCM
jgi:hypothetical protein